MKIKMQFSTGFFALFVALSSLNLASCGSASKDNFDALKAWQLQESLDNSVKELQIPGAVMGVRAPDGTTWFGASGYATLPQQLMASSSKNLQDGEPMSTDLFFRIASVTKTFTATIILQLVDEGKVSLDETIDEIIARWFPDYLGFAIPYGDTMTLENILQMRSGMVDALSTKEFMETAALRPLEYVSPKELLRMSAQSADPAPYAPDTRFDYNNTNFILQGIIIEQVTGNSYESELERRLLSPLGMLNSFIGNDIAMPEPYARGYLPGDAGLLDMTQKMTPSWAWAAGAMISTAGDLLNWMTALADGTFLSAETQAKRLEMQEGTIESWPISYGLGIYDDDGAIGHYGVFAKYYTSYCMRYHDYDFVVLENGELHEHSEEGRHPARSIFWNAVRDIGL